MTQQKRMRAAAVTVNRCALEFATEVLSAAKRSKWTTDALKIITLATLAVTIAYPLETATAFASIYAGAIFAAYVNESV